MTEVYFIRNLQELSRFAVGGGRVARNHFFLSRLPLLVPKLWFGTPLLETPFPYHPLRVRTLSNLC